MLLSPWHHQAAAATQIVVVWHAKTKHNYVLWYLEPLGARPPICDLRRATEPFPASAPTEDKAEATHVSDFFWHRACRSAMPPRSPGRRNLNLRTDCGLRTVVVVDVSAVAARLSLLPRLPAPARPSIELLIPRNDRVARIRLARGRTVCLISRLSQCRGAPTLPMIASRSMDGWRLLSLCCVPGRQTTRRPPTAFSLKKKSAVDASNCPISVPPCMAPHSSRAPFVATLQGFLPLPALVRRCTAHARADHAW